MLSQVVALNLDVADLMSKELSMVERVFALSRFRFVGYPLGWGQLSRRCECDDGCLGQFWWRLCSLSSTFSWHKIDRKLTQIFSTFGSHLIRLWAPLDIKVLTVLFACMSKPIVCLPDFLFFPTNEIIGLMV